MNRILRRTFRTGNLILRFSLPKKMLGSFDLSRKDFKSLHNFGKPLSLRIDFVHLENMRSDFRRKGGFACEFLDSYVMSKDIRAYSGVEIMHLVRSFFYLSRDKKFTKILKGIDGGFYGLFLYGLDSKTLMILDALKGHAHIFTCRPAHWKTNSTYMIDYSIYVLMNAVAPLADSLVLHCSAVAVNGKNCVFVGPSGSGKSTVSRLILKNVKGSRLIADDSLLVCMEKGGAYGYRIPFDKRGIAKTGCPKGFRIDRIFLIQKSDRAVLRRIRLKSALRFLVKGGLQNKFWFKDNVRKLPSVLFRLLSSCEFRKLCFPKNESFVRLIDF